MSENGPAGRGSPDSCPPTFASRLDRASRNKLTRRTASHFPGESLFARIARAVCEAGCLPRRELFESWECARRIRRRMRGGSILEVAGGHGLLSILLLLLDDSSAGATIIDVRRPPCHAKLVAALQQRWPRLAGRVEYRQQSLESLRLDRQRHRGSDRLVVSVHACGALTDRVLDLALRWRGRVAVLPCCHDLGRCDDGGLAGWLPGPLAIDATRVARLRAAGYRIHTCELPEGITQHRRLLLGWPAGAPQRPPTEGGEGVRDVTAQRRADG